MDCFCSVGIFLPVIIYMLSELPIMVPAYVVQTDNMEDSGITCWTCPEKGSNSECNDWAPDRFCPVGKTVCQTMHKFSAVSQKSIQVHKQCVLPTECSHDHVGCHNEGDLKVCVSCCNEPYCNKEVPLSNHTAISLSVTILQTSTASYVSFHWSVLSVISIATLLST